MMRRWSALYLIVLSLLFHQLNSSCFFFSDSCGFRGSSRNELDVKVHDPSRYSRLNLRPELSDNHRGGCDYDSLELKSILKKPRSRNDQNQKSDLIKRVSFSLKT